ncbi:hypothetical protein BJX70DRAFT_375816 [Aspergillus crustosus]
MATLVPINLADPTEFTELQHQRTACGWDNSPEKLALWRKKQEAGLKSFFWITKPDTVRAGHISLDAYTDPADPELANSSKTNLIIQQFYILPQHRAGGLGRTAMQQIEALAPSKPYGSANCEYITLNCLSKKHFYDEATGPYIRSVMPICNQEWYEKQGYVAWKEEPRYEDTLPDKTKVVWDATFMRKRVVRD